MTTTLETTCCIAGGGPAGMMLGLLLARAGVRVTVLEKHADFLRDFRGDTIHPSTLEVMHELGLLQAFLRLPHQEVEKMSGQVFGEQVTLADFSHLPTTCRFLALMPQWDFLDFLAGQARAHPGFELRMQAEVQGLTEAGGRVTGVSARTLEGALSVRCALVVGADGRHSTVRQQAGLASVDTGAPIDVLWFQLPRRESDGAATGGYVAPGCFFVMLNRDAYWQCGYVIPKGAAERLREQGLDAFRERLGALAPFLREALAGLTRWDMLKLLSVQVNHMPRWWRPGLLCIGDAAHAMSPVGGVGINLAIQDAVATANLLAAALREDRLTVARLQAVQRRREWPARVTQRAQVAVHERVIAPVLGARGARPGLPLPVRWMQSWPVLQRLPARLVGLGLRPEHVRSG